MARKYSKHDERRDHILDGAWDLFTQRGYDATTIATLIDHLEISKGAFYHYFSSKSEVLDAITDRLSAEALSNLRQVADDPALDAGMKFNRFLETARSWRAKHMDSVLQRARVLYQEENTIIRHKTLSRLEAVTTPLLQSILQQGVHEGVFNVSSTREAPLLFWQLSNAFGEAQMRTLLSNKSVDEKTTELSERALFVIESLERILGAPTGLIARPNRQFFASFAQASADAQGQAA